MSSNYMLKNIFSVKHLANPRKQRTFALANKKHRGVEQLVARQAHNLEVARSSRTPATKKGSQTASFYFFINSVLHPPRLPGRECLPLS